MYLLDPQKGRGRRAVLKDKTVALANAEKRAATAVLRNATNRMKGITHTARKALTSKTALSDHKLIQSIKSALGHVVEDVAGLEINCEGGRVKLSGRIGDTEIEKVLKAVWGVPGVLAVEHLLEIAGAAEPVQGSEERTSITDLSVPPAAVGAAALGGVLALYGFMRRDRIGGLLSTVGIGLLTRGIKEARCNEPDAAQLDSGWR